MDLQNRNNTPNQFVCPSDRQLALRAKLKSGWSCTKNSEPLKPEEQAAIISVIRRNEEIESAERQRVGRLVERVEKIKKHASVDRGPNCCRLCGDTFGLLRPHRIICEDCKKAVCTKCSVDLKICYHTNERTRDVWLCRVCSETREMWKKSGAWFFKGLPSYDMPAAAAAASASSTPTHGLAGGPGQRGGRGRTPTRAARVKKLTIRVNDSSSSSDDEERVETVSDKGGGGSGAGGGGLGAAGTGDSGLLVPGAEGSGSSGSLPLTPAVLSAPVSAASVVDSPPQRGMQREDSFRMRTFGSIRSFIDGGERKLSTAFFFNRQTSKSDNTTASQPELDSMSTASTATRRESSNYTRRSSISSSWSISDTSSGNSASAAVTSAAAPAPAPAPATHHSHHALHLRDPLLGWLEVAVSYREHYHSLDCSVARARDLPAMDAAGHADPYCKLNIVTPEGNTKFSRWQRTRTEHKTRNPEFNESVQFVGIEPDELAQSLLYVAVFDEDKYGHDFLGGAKIELAAVHDSNNYRISVPLTAEDRYSAEAEASQDWQHGKMLLALCYNTKKRALMVNVKQCINLIPMDNNGSSDPFVKLQMKPDPHKNKKYKTGIKWRTLNPIYNEEFHFEASPHDLNKQTLILTVWDKDIGKSNDFLGSLVIGYNSKGERLQQWLDCIRMPDHYHEKWHCLAGDQH